MNDLITILGFILTGAAGSALVTAFFMRRKTGGEAADKYAEASGKVASQYSNLLDEMRAACSDLAATRADNIVLKSQNEALLIEYRSAHSLIERLEREVYQLRLALRKQLKENGENSADMSA
jgi:hypothetical protein